MLFLFIAVVITNIGATAYRSSAFLKHKSERPLGSLPTTGLEPTCPMPSAASDTDFRSVAEHGIFECYGNKEARFDAQLWHHEESDSDFAHHGGDSESHVYGEVTFEGMYSILKEAVRVSSGVEHPTAADYAEYDFYDLGSGYGKFPMYAAFLGFKNAVGIELDSTRAGFAAERQRILGEKFPCLADRLRFTHSSFLEQPGMDWKRGAQKRVIFVAGLCMESLWPALTKEMQGAEWGEGTVVAALDSWFYANQTGLKRVSGVNVATTWGRAKIRLYQKKAYIGQSNHVMQPTG